MTRFLQYYETELEYMSRAFETFEEAHPQAAQTLGIVAGKSSDPDIQRLSDSLAMIAARLSQRLDDAVPEVTLDLTRLISPMFLLGAPSYCPVQLVKAQEDLREITTVKKGTELTFQASDGKSICRYVAAETTQLAPITVKNVTLETSPFPFRLPEGLSDIEAALTINIAPWDDEVNIAELGLKSLSLYVTAPAARKKRLMDVLAGEIQAICVSPAGNSRITHWLPSSSLSMNLASNLDTVLPSPSRTTSGFDRLRDFIAYPDQAAFFQISDLDGYTASIVSEGLTLRLFVNGHAAKRLGDTAGTDIAVNVVPLVNCYSDKTQPLRYDFARTQVPLLPATAADMTVASLQLTGIDKLTPTGKIALPSMTTPDRRRTDDLPVWQERHFPQEFDLLRRSVSFSVPKMAGDKSQSVPEPIDIVGELLCSNGHDATGIRPGQKGNFSDRTLADLPFSVLAEPTIAVLPDNNPDQLWNVLSLINANFASVFEAEEPARALREVLHLCAPTGFADSANAIWEVNVCRSVAPIEVGDSVLLAAGSKIEVVLDTAALPYATHVFAVVLNQFFSAFVSYDRFYQLTVRERGKDQPLRTFPKVHGGALCG